MLEYEIFTVDDESDAIYMSGFETFLMRLYDALQEEKFESKFKNPKFDIKAVYNSPSDYKIICTFTASDFETKEQEMFSTTLPEHYIIRTPGTNLAIKGLMILLRSLCELQMDEEAFNAILEYVTCDYENDNPKKYNELMSQYRASKIDREQALLQLVDDTLCPKMLRELDKIIGKTNHKDNPISIKAMYFIRRMTISIISIYPNNFGKYIINSDILFAEIDHEDYLEFIFETPFRKAVYSVSYPIRNYLQCDRHWLCKCINQAAYHIYCTVMTMLGNKLDESDPYTLRSAAAKVIEAEIDDLLPVDKHLYIVG